MGTDDKLGFIMFECGLEGISLKIVKKSKFEQSETTVIGSVDGPSVDSMKSNENLESAANTPKTAPHDSNRASTNKDSNTPKTEKKHIEEDNHHNELEKDNGKDSGNVSSCIIELKMVWFNFAAPPRAPITRKIDYTR